MMNGWLFASVVAVTVCVAGVLDVAAKKEIELAKIAAECKK